MVHVGFYLLLYMVVSSLISLLYEPEHIVTGMQIIINVVITGLIYSKLIIPAFVKWFPKYSYLLKHK